MRLLSLLSLILFVSGCITTSDRSHAGIAVSTPLATAKTLCALPSFRARGPLTEAEVNELTPCLTPELAQHLHRCRADISRWMHSHQNTIMKLPFTEGGVFIGCYEAIRRIRVGRVSSTSDTAEVELLATTFEGYHYTSLARMKRAGDSWLLDDIGGGDDSSTLRRRTDLTQKRTRANKTDAGNGSKAICRVSNVLRSPSPDPRRSAKKLSLPS